MALQSSPDALRWRVHLHAPPAAVYELLSTDSGRTRFWVERSRQDHRQVALAFPDGSTTMLRILSEQPPLLWEVSYFDVLTRFVLEPASPDSTILDVTALRVPPSDLVEIAAGWVSVLLNLKATVNFGQDLRNHDRARSWSDGFIDN